MCIVKKYDTIFHVIKCALSIYACIYFQNEMTIKIEGSLLRSTRETFSHICNVFQNLYYPVTNNGKLFLRGKRYINSIWRVWWESTRLDMRIHRRQMKVSLASPYFAKGKWKKNDTLHISKRILITVKRNISEIWRDRSTPLRYNITVWLIWWLYHWIYFTSWNKWLFAFRASFTGTKWYRKVATRDSYFLNKYLSTIVEGKTQRKRLIRNWLMKRI